MSPISSADTTPETNQREKGWPEGRILGSIRKHSLPITFAASVASSVAGYIGYVNSPLPYAPLDSETSSTMSLKDSIFAKNNPWAFLDICVNRSIAAIQTDDPVVHSLLLNRGKIKERCIETLISLEGMDESSLLRYFVKQHRQIQSAEDPVEKFFSIWMLVSLLFFFNAYPLAYGWTIRNMLKYHSTVSTPSFMWFATWSTLWSVSGYMQWSDITGIGYAILASAGMITVLINEFVIKHKLNTGEWLPIAPGSDKYREIMWDQIPYLRSDSKGIIRDTSPALEILLNRCENWLLLESYIRDGINTTTQSKEGSHYKVELDTGREIRFYSIKLEPIIEDEKFFWTYTFIEDITDAERNAQIIKISPSPIVVYAKDGSIQEWNDAMTEFTGVTKHEMEELCRHLGLTPMQILYSEPREWERVMEYLRMLETGEIDEYRWVAFTITRPKDNIKRTAMWNSIRFADGSIRVARDVTKELAFQDELFRDQLVEAWSRLALAKDIRDLFAKKKKTHHSGRRTNDAEEVNVSGNQKEHYHLLFMFDLDGFKRINDTYGHKAGDVILKAFADQMNARFRETDSLYRNGWDEFIFLARHTRMQDFHPVFEKFCKEIWSVPIYINSTTGAYTLNTNGIGEDAVFIPGINVSVGGCEFTTEWLEYNSQTEAVILSRADSLMYKSKSRKGQPDRILVEIWEGEDFSI